MRWSRRLAVAGVAALAFAATAAGAGTSGRVDAATVDRTLSCPVPEWGGVNLLRVGASPRGRPIRLYGGKLEPRPGGIGADIGPSTNVVQLASFTGGKAGYTLDDHVCAPTRRIPLAPSGLPFLGVFGVNSGWRGRECWVASRITLRVRATLGRSGVPLTVDLAVRSGRRQRPVAFIRWTQTRARAFFAPICHRAYYPGQ